MSVIREQSNEIFKANEMPETDKESLTTNWQGSNQSTFYFRILHRERNRIFNRVAKLFDFQKRR